MSTLVANKLAITGGLVGVDVIHVTISPALGAPPSHVWLPVFEKAAPGDDSVQSVSIDSKLASGYNVNLSATTVAGQTMHYAYLT
jgi:hypothetical protein